MSALEADLCIDEPGRAAVDYFERASHIIGWDSSGEPSKMLFGAQQSLYNAAGAKRRSDRAKHLLVARMLTGRALDVWESEQES